MSDTDIISLLREYLWAGVWIASPMLLTALIVGVFGGLTLWLQDETFIKMKPTIVQLIFAVVLFGGLLFRRPLLKPLLGTAWPLDDEGWHKLSFRFAVFFLAEYANMILISVLSAVMFLGGWLSPFQGTGIIESTDIAVFQALLGPGIHWLVLKVALFLFCFLWFRATFPRYRYDQIMRLGWKVFIPLTIVWIVVVGVAIMAELPPWFDKA